MEKKKITARNNSQRMLWPDVIRIVAIFLVVQIHTFVAQPSSSLTFVFSKLAIICVPLFIMLSGALLLNKQEHYVTFFKKRFLKVLVPWIFWTIIYMFYFLYFSQPANIKAEYFSNNTAPFFQWLQYFLVLFLSNLWFLPIIFGLYIVIPLFRIFEQHAKFLDRWYLVILWFVFASLLPFLYPGALFPKWEASIIFTIFQYSGYLFLGSMLAKKKILKNFSLSSLILLGVLPFIVTALFWQYKIFYTFTEGFLDPGTVLASVFIFAFLFKFSNRYQTTVDTQKMNIIAAVSKAGLGVYIIHKFVMDFLLLQLHFSQKDFSAMGITFLVFVVATCIVILFQRIPLLKFIVP